MNKLTFDNTSLQTAEDDFREAVTVANNPYDVLRLLERSMKILELRMKDEFMLEIQLRDQKYHYKVTKEYLSYMGFLGIFRKMWSIFKMTFFTKPEYNEDVKNELKRLDISRKVMAAYLNINEEYRSARFDQTNAPAFVLTDEQIEAMYKEGGVIVPQKQDRLEPG